MSRIIKIYCEGKAGSHDFDILSKVISNLKSSQIQIDPIGSVRGAGAIIAYKESGSVKSDFKLFFRDRDFDKAIPDEPVLENDESKKYLYYSYRNTIENYLFSPKCLFDFILEKKLSQYGVNNESEAKQKLIEAAGKIRYYQAVRHTMGKMRTDKTNFDTKWTEKSGILPKNLDENHCKQKAWERIKTSKTFTDEWTIEKFDEILAYFLAKFDAGDRKSVV